MSMPPRTFNRPKGQHSSPDRPVMRDGRTAPSAAPPPAKPYFRTSHFKVRARQVLFLLAAAAFLRYLLWRAEFTQNPQALWFFYLFLAAESMAFVEIVLFYFTAWKPTRHKVRPVLPGRTVDVFIATYNEPPTLVRETVVGALAMRYPHKTYILDDGNRSEMRWLAEELGCGYIARTAREHAKAGNLNNALFHGTDGEFVVLLDADHVPMPNLIEDTIGFFADEKVAVVQTPQDFYNLDSFQHETDWKHQHAWQQQEFFFSVIEPGKDFWNAALFCGSPGVVRRSALEAIGGFAVGTVTEDFHTSVRLQAGGHRLVYFNKTLARGLAPQTFGFFAGQWLRWGQGAMQILRQEKPFFRRGLSWAQKLCFFSSIYFYWMSYQKLIYIFTPIFALASGILPLQSDLYSFLFYFGPYFGLNMAASIWVYGGTKDLLLSEQFSLIKLHVLMKSALGFRKKERKFVVTPKTRGQSSGLSEVWPQAVIVAMACVSIAVGIARMPGAVSFQVWGIWVSLFWAVYWLALTYPVVRRALKKHEARVAYRFGGRIDVPIRFHNAGSDGAAVSRAYAGNLNRYGLSFTHDYLIPVGTLLDLQLTLPQCEISALVRVVRNDPLQVGKHLTRFVNGVKFEQIRIQDQDEISRYLFSEVAPKQGEWLRLTHKTQTEPITTEPNLDLAAAAKTLPVVFLLCFLWVPEAHGQADSHAVQKGNRLLADGRPVAAIAYFQQALIEDPVDAAALRGMGKTREWQGKFADAAEFYGRAVRIEPQDAESWFGLGRVQGWRGEREDAYQAFEKALSLDPNHVEIQLAYAEALSWDPASRNKSIALYRSVLAQHPGLAPAETGLAQVLAWTGHAKEAGAAYDEVLKREPANAQALLGKAEMAQWTARHLEARELLARAQQVSPSDPRVLGALGETQVSLGQYEQASALADQLGPLDADSSSRLQNDIRRARRPYFEMGYGFRREEMSPVESQGEYDSYFGVLSFPVSSGNRLRLGFAPTIYRAAAGHVSLNEYRIGLESRPSSRVLADMEFRTDTRRGSLWNETGSVALSYLVNDSVKMRFGAERAIVSDSVHSALGSQFDGQFLGRVRSNQAAVGLAATSHRRGMDTYLTFGGGFYDGAHLDRNWRMSFDGGFGKTLRGHHPYIRAGYAVTVFRFTEDQSFLPGLGAPLRHAGGYFSPQLFLNNAATLSISDRIGHWADWSAEGSLGLQQVKDRFNTFDHARLSSTFRGQVSFLLTERFRLSLGYDFLDVGAAYRRNQFSVALRSYF